MSERSWVLAPAPYTGWIYAICASCYIKEKLKIKVAKWGTPKKYYFFKSRKCVKVARTNKTWTCSFPAPWLWRRSSLRPTSSSYFSTSTSRPSKLCGRLSRRWTQPKLFRWIVWSRAVSRITSSSSRRSLTPTTTGKQRCHWTSEARMVARWHRRSLPLDLSYKMNFGVIKSFFLA